tara:strand:+ start:3292 stop:3426 length:135 start_codon:yes stop_codon:yes gene_type:complete
MPLVLRNCLFGLPESGKRLAWNALAASVTAGNLLEYDIPVAILL